MRLYDISCFLAVVRFPYEISCLLALVPHTVVSKLSGIWGWCGGGDEKACMLVWEKGGGTGEYVEKVREVLVVHEVRVYLLCRPRYFFCVACERNPSSLSCRQFFSRQKLVHHRFAAICGTGVHHRISLRLCHLTFARALLEHIVHRARWRRQFP
jgi:hypothetical protein